MIPTKLIIAQKDEKSPLPSTFKPHEYSVIIAKGTNVRKTPGNRKFQDLIDSHLKKYQETQHRREKVEIVSDIYDKVQDQSNHCGAFIKFDGEHWWEVSETTAREKITAAFRNRLSHRYKSSSKSKSARRRNRKALHQAVVTHKNTVNETKVVDVSAPISPNSAFSETFVEDMLKSTEKPNPEMFEESVELLREIFAYPKNKGTILVSEDENSVSGHHSDTSSSISNDTSVGPQPECQYAAPDVIVSRKPFMRRSNPLRMSAFLFADGMHDETILEQPADKNVFLYPTDVKTMEDNNDESCASPMPQLCRGLSRLC